jgi:3-deoxy-D-manno-octulosonic-acid transferase
MRYLLDFIYLLGLLVLSPWLAYKALTTGKYRRGLFDKLFGRAFLRLGDKPCAWFHGVSVGEIHLLRPVVTRFRQHHPDWDCVISTTTDTGFEEARKHFADLAVFFWPLDFSWAARRALRRVNPSLVVLAEGELWPNFLATARARELPIALVNGRISPRSYRRYQCLGKLARRLFARVDLFAVQTEEYAASLRALGVVAARVQVTGSVKYDGVVADRQNVRTQELRRLLRVEPDDLVWIAGSTQPPEEQIALEIFRQARTQHPNLRLFLVPRQKERFGEIADWLRRTGQAFVRRSSLSGPVKDRQAVVLVDTIGELSALWGLADIAFVGGSLDGRRGGQNMIEPAAYGAAVVFGPHVWNFRDTAARLTAAGAAIQIANAAELETAVQRLLADPEERQRLGRAAQQFVQSQQGATARTLACLDRLLLMQNPWEHAA